MKNLKLRLIVMNFLEFAVWGAYLTCMGNYLGRAGMGSEISWFYAIQGIVSIFMPTLMGIVADKYIQPQRLLGICHLIAGMAMIALAYMGMTNPMPNKVAFITIYTLSVALRHGYREGLPAHPRVRYHRFHRHDVVCQLRSAG